MAAPNATKRVSLVATLVGVCATWIAVLGLSGSVLAAHAVDSYGYDAPGHVVAAPQHVALVASTPTNPTGNLRAAALVARPAPTSSRRWSTPSISLRRAAKGAGAAARTAARNLAEKLSLDEAKGGAGKRIMQGKINDPRYPEDVWAKIQHVHQNPDGSQTVVHYWENLQTGAREGFKFK